MMGSVLSSRWKRRASSNAVSRTTACWAFTVSAACDASFSGEAVGTARTVLAKTAKKILEPRICNIEVLLT